MNFIYKITNDINGKLYIGKTNRSIETRFQEHINFSKRAYKNRPLYDAMNKYGVNHFHIEQIDICETDEEASTKEIYWIAYYDTYRHGYNATLGGDGKQLLDLNEEAIIEKYQKLKSKRAVGRYFNVDEKTIRNILNKYDVPLIDNRKQIAMMKNNKILKVFSGRKEANIFLGISIRSIGISKALSKMQKTAYGYEWKYLEELAV